MKLLSSLLILAYALSQVCVHAQNCPAIKYSQNVHQVAVDSGAPAFAISFINSSPYLPLSFLDVHYRLNDDMVHNFRILSAENTDKPVLRGIKPFLLQPGEFVTYNFTYQVAGLDFACNTPSFRVNADPLLSMATGMMSTEGREIRETVPLEHEPISMSVRPTTESSASVGVSESQSQPIQRPVATEAPRPHLQQRRQEEVVAPVSRPAATGRSLPIQQSAQTQTTTPVPRSIPVSSMPVSSMHPRGNSGPLIQPVAGAYGMFPEDQQQDLGKMPTATDGACPLINYDQKIMRSSDSNKYMISFHNLSPEEDLEFLDVHYKISDFPLRNVRIFSNPELGNKANEGSVSGLQLTPEDVMRYSFTYGIGKRACYTDVFTVHANEIEEN